MFDRFDAYDKVGNRVRQRNRRIELGLAQINVLWQSGISRNIHADTSREARTHNGPQVSTAASHVDQQLAADSQGLDGLSHQALDRRLARALALKRARENVIKGCTRLRSHWPGDARRVD